MVQESAHGDKEEAWQLNVILIPSSQENTAPFLRENPYISACGRVPVARTEASLVNLLTIIMC